MLYLFPTPLSPSILPHMCNQTADFPVCEQQTSKVDTVNCHFADAYQGSFVWTIKKYLFFQEGSRVCIPDVNFNQVAKYFNQKHNKLLIQLNIHILIRLGSTNFVAWLEYQHISTNIIAVHSQKTLSTIANASYEPTRNIFAIKSRFDFILGLLCFHQSCTSRLPLLNTWGFNEDIAKNR